MSTKLHEQEGKRISILLQNNENHIRRGSLSLINTTLQATVPAKFFYNFT
jgi:hypothetical protein